MRAPFGTPPRPGERGRVAAGAPSAAARRGRGGARTAATLASHRSLLASNTHSAKLTRDCTVAVPYKTFFLFGAIMFNFRYNTSIFIHHQFMFF